MLGSVSTHEPYNLSLTIFKYLYLGCPAYSVYHTTVAVGVPCPDSESINAVAHVQLISVPVHPLTALVTVTALANHLVQLVITKWSVSRTTVSVHPVAVLIPACITAAIQSSSVVSEKSNHVIS